MIPMISEEELILRLILAAVLGGVVGYERERLSWVAGFRTHMLVCLGATLIMIVSQYGFHQVISPPNVALDPSRVAAQVVSGIGFLGAGTILFLKNVVRGLTTAASLWAVAAVGLSIGGGLYLAAVFSTALIFFILAIIKPLERKFMRRSQERGIKIVAKENKLDIKGLEELVNNLNMKYGPCNLHIDKIGDQEIIYIIFASISTSHLIAVMDETRPLLDVAHVETVEDFSQVAHI